MNARQLVLLSSALFLWPTGASAHWCSNIYRTYARIVVKPERQQINIPQGQTGTLKVRVRNNFPYTLAHIKLRANNPTGYTVTVSPTPTEAQQKRFFAGQETTFTLTITNNSASSGDVSALNLEIGTQVEDLGCDWNEGYCQQWINQNASVQTLVNYESSAEQTECLHNALIALRDCSQSCTGGSCGLSRVNTLYSRLQSDGGTEGTDTHQHIRAGQQLAIRLRYGDFTGCTPSRDTVVATFRAAMNASNATLRGYAAFLAAYGLSDATTVARITEIATTGSGDAQDMARAGLLILGQNNYLSNVTSCYQRKNGIASQACAVALAINGDDAPMTSYLVNENQVGSGTNTSYARLFASYLLQLAVIARRGGPDGAGVVSFLDEDAVTDTVAPKAPTNLSARKP